ncbi:Ger(x)C family spore germination protein [Paenibacillus oceani]|uniref:Ger(X)C family spore germination protein n=1 Tax=Paenibacillus oceani TaxID=2772510 RepID=A0A927C712_9BACL|nr:Ger(x)C family spore germination protein [Paenibacillus oceani]MBD2861162.1 Ger(x)C family spore germination protein [Paenibacillus oceani]
MRAIRTLLAAALIPLLLTGCWGIREIEHLVYLNSVGVDYKDGKVVFYGQVVSFFNVAKKEGGDQAQKQLVSIVKAEGDSFDKAVFNMYTTAQQRIAWSHVKSLVFTEEALEKRIIEQVFDVWDRYYENRYTIWVFATKEPIERVFEATPIQNVSVVYSQLNDPKDIYAQNSVVAPIYLYDFIRTWHEKSQALKLPFLAIDDSWRENGNVKPKLEMSGIGVFHNKSYKGDMPRISLHGLRWLNPKTVRTPLYVKSGQGGAATESTIVLENVKPRIEAEVSGGKAAFRISISAAGNIPQLEQDVQEKELERLAEAKIKSEIKKTYTEGLNLGADVLGLSEALYRAKPKQWHDLIRNGKLPLRPDSIVSIEVSVDIVSGGISKIKR